MDEKALNWIADVVNEAIAKATAPLTERIETLTIQLQQLQATQTPCYDDTEVKQAVRALRENPPTPYDDGALKSAFSEQGKRVAAVIEGVQAIKDRIEEVAKSVPAVYDDATLRKQIEEVAKSIPAAYDDTEALKTVAQVVEAQQVTTEALQAINERVKQLAERPVATPADGRDALQLEVLPNIDEQKSYTRGTYAKHAGGLWRSFEQTSGLRGWECIVDGIADVVISPSEEDPRVVGLEIKRASGASDAVVIAVPAMVYKGVFKSESGDGYAIGDTVTWAGSLWHCNVTGTKALPGDGSADWTLAVKKGRDGREVVKTERKEGPVQL